MKDEKEMGKGERVTGKGETFFVPLLLSILLLLPPSDFRLPPCFRLPGNADAIPTIWQEPIKRIVGQLVGMSGAQQRIILLRFLPDQFCEAAIKLDVPDFVRAKRRTASILDHLDLLTEPS